MIHVPIRLKCDGAYWPIGCPTGAHTEATAEWNENFNNDPEAEDRPATLEVRVPKGWTRKYGAHRCRDCSKVDP